jgi:hypothetical protein
LPSLAPSSITAGREHHYTTEATQTSPSPRDTFPPSTSLSCVLSTAHHHRRLCFRSSSLPETPRCGPDLDSWRQVKRHYNTPTYRPAHHLVAAAAATSPIARTSLSLRAHPVSLIPLSSTPPRHVRRTSPSRSTPAAVALRPTIGKSRLALLRASPSRLRRAALAALIPSTDRSRKHT